jgi:ribosomal protein L40E
MNEDDEIIECRFCHYKGSGWRIEYERMEVDYVEGFYICPKCNAGQ